LIGNDDIRRLSGREFIIGNDEPILLFSPMLTKRRLSAPRNAIYFSTLAIFVLCLSSLNPVVLSAQVLSVSNSQSKTSFLASSSLNQTYVDTSTSLNEIPVVQNSSEPLAITVDTSGNVWFAENNPAAIVEYSPSAQNFSAFKIPTTAASMIWFILFDNSGNLWFSNALQPYLWSFSLATHQFENFSTGNGLVDPYALAYDNSSQLIWFTSIYTDQIGSFHISGNVATLAGLINVTGTARSSSFGPSFGPSGILIDSQGDIFVSETFSGEVAEYSQSEQKFVNNWELPAGSEPVGIALDNSSHKIWFANHATSLFGYIDENTGSVTEYATSLFSYLYDNITLPYWIQLSSNGNIWFDEHEANKMARFDPLTGQLTEFSIPTNQSAPLRFVIDNQRNLVWFTEFVGGKLGELSENLSCACSVQLSKDNLTLSHGIASFFVKYTNATNYGLFNGANEPLISGSLSIDGYLSENLSISSVSLNSSYYRVSLKGMNLAQGNYTVTVCPSESSLTGETYSSPVRQCAIASLIVLQSTPSLNALTAILAVVILGVALAVSLYFVRRWRG
jgi:streptogramin lyase